VRRLLAAGLVLALVSAATPAAAYVVEVTTSVSVSDASDQGQLRAAVQSAVDDVLSGAIAFAPTLVVLTRAVVVGERLYVRLLIADAEGEQAVKDFADGDTGPEPAEGEIRI
jgi:hypothetical protein